MKKVFALLVLGLLAFFVGCQKEPELTAMSVADMAMYVGNSQAVVIDFEGARDTVEYTVEDATVAKIIGGIVIGQKVGTTDVTVKAKNFDVSCTFKVTVKERVKLGKNISFENWTDGQPDDWTIDKTISSGSSLGSYNGGATTGEEKSMSYWCGKGENEADDVITIKQTLTITEAGDYCVTIMLISTNVNYKDAHIYLKYGDKIVTKDISTITGWNDGVYTEMKSQPLNVPAGTEVEFGLSIESDTYNAWMTFDDLYVILK